MTVTERLAAGYTKNPISRNVRVRLGQDWLNSPERRQAKAVYGKEWRKRHPVNVKMHQSRRLVGADYVKPPKRTPDDIKRGRKASKLKRTYGIDPAVVAAMVLSQGGLCAAGSHPLHDDLNVDHDHGTGRVRGITCLNCNTAMGLTGDDPERLRALANYLDRFPFPTV